MALRATTPLVPSPRSTTRPVNASFTFRVTVVDRQASAPSQRALELVLASSNDLTFGSAKTVSQVEMVGSDPVQVTFSGKRIKGSGADLDGFRVTLREGTKNLPFCVIGIE